MTTPNNSGPDYTRYSLERLQEARRNIDTERFPERTHLLDVLIADRQLRGEVIPPPPAEPSRHSLPEPKTPGQALLMMAASAMFISLIAVISYKPTTTHPQGKWFLILLGVIGAYQIAHFALCYVQLRKQQTATPTQSDAPASPGNSAQPARDRQAVRSAPVTKTKSPAGNTSPIERL